MSTLARSVQRFFFGSTGRWALTMVTGAVLLEPAVNRTVDTFYRHRNKGVSSGVVCICLCRQVS